MYIIRVLTYEEHMIETDDIEQSWVGFVVVAIGLAIFGIGALFRKLFKD